MKNFLIFFLVIIGNQLFAQPITINKDKLNKKIDSLFQSFNNKNSPGFAITVIQNGKVVTKKTVIMTSIDHQIPLFFI